MIDLDAVVAATGELKPLPATAARLTQLLTKEEVDLREVAKVVSLDAPLTARLLSTANSAMYGGRVTISSVETAVTRLGSGVVLSLAISATLQREMNAAIPHYNMGEGALWHRSIASALAAESLKASLPRTAIPSVTFTAALLHDIGRLVMARFLDDEALAALERARESSDETEEQLEHRVLGIHHAEVGAKVAEKWKLPHVIQHAILHVHSPDDGAEATPGVGKAANEPLLDVICDVVHVADGIARHLLAGDAEALERLSRNALARIRCDDGALAAATERTRARLDQTIALYGG